MLPKEEKIKKKPESKQEGLFDKENERKRIARKRFIVITTMVFTVGLSLFFWIYRYFKNNPLTFPQFPQVNLNFNQIGNSSLTLPKSSSSWSIYLKQLNSDKIIYQQHQDSLFLNQDETSLTNQLDQNKAVVSSQYSSLLPSGLDIREIIDENNNNFSYFSKITTPNQRLLLIIAVNQPSDLNQIKNQLPSIIDQLYWYSLQK